MQQGRRENYPKAIPIHTAPMYIIHEKLSTLSGIVLGEHEDAKRKTERDFWAPINKAWDALTYYTYDHDYDHYEVYSAVKHGAALYLDRYYERTGETTIKLSDPQIRIIDALTEACGIPHKRGQAEFEIPQEAIGYREALAERHKKNTP